MALILTDSQNYSDIATAIRTKKGVTTTYKPNQMAAAINAIPYIDTSDATATAADLAIGTTAYIDGSKITGTMRTIGANGINWAALSGIKWNSLSTLTWNELPTSSLGIEDGLYKVELLALSNGNYQLIITDAFTPTVLDTTKPIEQITYNGVQFALVSPRRNIFNLAFCQFESYITSHVDIDDYGSTFTVQSGTTSGNAVYFMLDPDVTYNISWTSQNCILLGYSNSWELIIDEGSGDGQHALSNVTNVHYCYFCVFNTSSSLTGTFQDVIINEV